MRIPSSITPRLRLLRAPLLLAASLLALLAFAQVASAADLTLTSSPDNPTVGDDVTVTSPRTECAGETYEFTVDGTARPASTQFTVTTKFASAGDHVVSVERRCANNNTTDSGSLTIAILPELAPKISVSPDPPYLNDTATLSATQTGGFGPPFTYAWDLDNDGSYDDSTDRTVQKVFDTEGEHTVRLQVTDSATPPHVSEVERTFTIGERPANVPAPPPPPPCVKNLTFSLAQFTTTGCFARSEAGRWTTTDTVKLNGIVFPDYGQTFVITEPTAAEPGGHFYTASASIQVGSLSAYSGFIDWSLPSGQQGETKTLRTLAVPSFAKLFGLRVLGSADLKLTWAADGKRSAVFGLNIELPGSITAGPNRQAATLPAATPPATPATPTTGTAAPAAKIPPGAVTGAASIRVDEQGPHYDGLKLSASDVYIGKIGVPEVCFSYVPAGGQTEPCEAPQLDGKPYLTCNTDTNTDRWDGNAVIELPTESKTRIAAFGGLGNGQITKLGGFVDNLGTTVPIVPGVFLNRVGLGLCLSPPPFKIRGDVGVQMLRNLLKVNGRFQYTDPYLNSPWSVQVGGNAYLDDLFLGDASVDFNAWGDIGFGVRAKIDLKDVASIEGQVNGWVEPRNNTFNIEGGVRGCLVSVLCARADGLISSTGLAGCIDAGTLRLPYPSNPRQGPFGFGSVSFDVRYYEVPLHAGFGYTYGGSVSTLGNSCDFSPYRASRTAGAAASAAGLSERIAPGTKAVAFNVRGSNGPPKIVVRGPGGTRIVSPANARGVQRKGRYMLVENKTTKSTSVMLVKPAAGRWTVAAAPGAKSKPVRIERSSYEAPPALFGQARWIAPYRREVAFQYAVPAGAKVQLIERGKKGITRTLIRSVRGKPCRGAPKLPGGRTLLCVRKKFRLARGPGGPRTVQALVTRNGIPITRRTVAHLKAPRQPVASKPSTLTLRRSGDGIVAIFGESTNASRYNVIAILSDGRRRSFDLSSRCRAVRIPAVPSGVSAAVNVAGVRYDVKTGEYRGASLAAGRASAGPAKKLPKKICG